MLQLGNSPAKNNFFLLVILGPENRGAAEKSEALFDLHATN